MCPKPPSLLEQVIILLGRQTEEDRARSEEALLEVLRRVAVHLNSDAYARRDQPKST